MPGFSGQERIIDLSQLKRQPASSDGQLLTLDSSQPGGVGLSAGATPSAGSVGSAQLDTALGGSADGLAMYPVARATFDPTAVSGHRSIGAHTFGVTIPAGSIAIDGYYDVITALHDGAGDAATINITAGLAGGDLNSGAVAINDASFAVGVHHFPLWDLSPATGFKLATAQLVTVTVAGHALTGGKLRIFVQLYPSSVA